ncbi:Fur family transcriptional regulator [Methanothrix sp.]|uniref:Fur family transcriptional regulator n=1 Tax=Methanothrix sp. TaxID=90426 RepID=UPI003C7233DB
MNSAESLDQTIIKTFRNSGYRATPQRIAISRYILRNHEHPTAQRTYQEIKRTHPTVSLATIYTTIKILKETGLICELNLPQSQTRYDPNTEPHVHLICLQCGSITDWMDPIMQKLVRNISRKANFTVIGSSFDLEGVCESCHRRAKEALKSSAQPAELASTIKS